MGLHDIIFAPGALPLLGAAIVITAKAFLSGRPLQVLEYTGAAVGLGRPWAAFAVTLEQVASGEVFQGVIGNWHASVGITYQYNGLAWLVNVLAYSVCTAAWIYSLGAGPRGPAFTSVFLILTASLSATILTSDIFNLFVCLEVVGISSYILVASTDKPGASLASFTYLMISASAMVFFLIGVYGLYRITGSLSYQGIAEGLASLPPESEAAAVISLALIISSTVIRVAVMPFSGWLPDAHALAPHAVSAVLSGVLIKVPLFALSRVLVIIPAGTRAGELLGWAGAVTALAGVVLALAQSDAKRLLAFHSVSQIGYVVCAWGTALAVGPATPIGAALMTAAFLHAFFHALFKGLLFLSVGTTVDRAGERNVYRLRGAAAILRAGGERIPATLLSFAAGALAISAVPPFNGFISKNAIAYALAGSPLYNFLAAAGVGTAASFIKLSRIYWPAKTPAAAPQGTPVPAACRVSQAALAVLCLAGGIAALPIHSMTTLLLSGAVPAVSIQWYTPASLLKALLAAVLGAGLYGLTTTSAVSRVLKTLREQPGDFRNIYISFSLGTAVLAGWMLLGI